MNKLFTILLLLGCFKLNAMNCEKFLMMPSEDVMSEWLAHEGFEDFDNVTKISSHLAGKDRPLFRIQEIVDTKIAEYKKHIQRPDILELELEEGTLEKMKNARNEILGVILQAGYLYN